MKFTLTFREDDNADEDLRVAVNESLISLGLDEDEIEAVFDVRLAKVGAFCEEWISRNGLTVEFDTEAGTCAIVENK